MKVLHFFKTYFPDSYGGVEQVIHQIAMGSAEHGVSSSVLTLSNAPCPAEIIIDNHKVIRCKQSVNIASTGFSFEVFRRFKALAEQADIIHYHYPWPLMDVVHFVTKMNKPTIVTYHSDIVRQQSLLKLYRPLRNHFLSHVDRIVATSPNYLATSPVLQKFKHKVDVIPIGLDKSSYPIVTEPLTLKWQNQLGSDFFLFVGVLRYYKGLHILIEAAKGTTYPIVIVGAGPVEAELKAQVDKLGLKNVFFVGRVSDEDKVALIKLSFAVVFPSHLRSEAFGISLLEGAMYGKPMISSEIGTGTTYINIHQETGLVVPPDDPDALRSAMTWLWNNRKLTSEMAKNAESRYWSLFTAERMVDQYVKVYRELLK